jgi:signal transduction histidine kinase
MHLSKTAIKSKGHACYKKARFKLLKFIILILLFQIKPVVAKDYISERAYFEDKTGNLSFQEVKGKNFKKIDSVLAKGYSDSAFWLRLKINPLVESNFKSLLLRIQPTYVDSIQLFDSADNTNAKRIVGDIYPVISNDYSSINFNFVIPGSDKERYVWLKINTTGTYFIATQAFTINEFINTDLIQQIFSAFYIGVLCFLFIFPLTIWIRDKDALNIIFVVKQFAAVVLVVMDTGIQRLLFKEASPLFLKTLFNYNFITYTAIMAGFHYFFLKDYHPKRWVNILFLIAIACYPLEIIALANKYFIDSLYFNSLMLTVMAIAFFFIPFFGLDWKKNNNPMFSKKSMIIIYHSIGLSILLTSLPSLGFITGNSFSMIPGLFSGCITGIVFLFVLQYRNRMFREQGVREVAQANAMATFERSKRQEKERFISMLTHELKTPLSVLKLAYESGDVIKTDKHVEGALKDINDVIDRCALEDKLENQGFKLLVEQHSLKRIIYQKISEYGNADRFKFTVDGDLWIESDLKLLRIILGNLLDNAMKYGDENNSILIDAKVKNQIITLTVANTIGEVGLPDEEKIFTKYYRAEKAHKYTGSGLGLYLVINLIKLLKGQARYFVSTDRKLITFELTLPEKM